MLTPSQNRSTRPAALTVVAIASVITAAFMGSVVVTPLYSLYQAKFGFSDITLTLVYAVYMIGNVVALLLFGQISDQLGRKRVALPALGLAALSSLSFLFAPSTLWLFVGRLLIGLAVGILSGTGTAWLAERFGPTARSTATVTAAAANMTGIAVGPLLGGLLAQYAPAPLVLPFVAYLVILAAVATAVALTPESREGRIDRLHELRFEPRVGVPRDRLAAFAAPGITGFVTFALGGLYFALIPIILGRELHERNLSVSGLVVCELAVIAVVLIIVGRHLKPGTAMTTGLLALIPGVALVAVAQAAQSELILVLASALAGVSLSLGYRGSLEVVNRIAPDDRRAEVVSSYYICCFVGNALPVIGIGVLSAVVGSFVADAVFAVVIALLSVAALVLFRWQPQDTHTG